jgi:MarR family transcriptional repressor of emrRAB
VRQSTDARLTNMLGALSLAVADRVREATEEAAGQISAAPAALVALDGFLAGRTIDDLRRVVDLTPSGAVRLVDRLADAGLVKRRPGADARSLSLVLTATGRRRAARIRTAREMAVASLLDGLSANDRTELARLTEHLLRSVTAHRLADRAADRIPHGGWLCRLCDLDACGRQEGRCPAAATASEAPVATTAESGAGVRLAPRASGLGSRERTGVDARKK